MSDMRTRNLVAAILLLALCAGYAYLTANLPVRAIQNSTQPSFFPWVITIIMTVLSLSLLIQGIWNIGSRKNKKESDFPLKRSLRGLFVFVVYFSLLPYLGFFIANIPFFAALMVLYGERRPVWIGGGSVIITTVIFFLFREAFKIRLPAGLLDGII